jgi:hypothetical protein
MFKWGAGVPTLVVVALSACGGGQPSASALTTATAQPAAQAAQPTGGTSQAGPSVTLSPQAVKLENPARRGGVAPQAEIKLSLTATDRAGHPITRGALPQPVQIHVYGPSPAVVTPTTAVIRTATPTVRLHYNGRFVANPVIVTAVYGHAFAQASLQPRNHGFSGSSAVTFPMNRQNNIKRGWGMFASVGGGPQHYVEIDTGSRGLVIPKSILGRGAIGPGPPGHITYTSDGKEFLGHYWLAPLKLSAGGATVTTVPIRVLAVEAARCAPGYPRCRSTQIGGVMGVGFARGSPSSMPPELTNAFLALTGVTEGSMHPGYIIRRSSVTLGISAGNQAGFNELPLTPGGTGPGDWNTESGCFSFPRLPAYPRQCGTVLVDTGLPSAIIGLPKTQRPASMRSTIPDGTPIRIDVGLPRGPSVLSYGFTTGATNQPQAPTSIRWAGDPKPFVNTSRHPIALYDYLFDDGSGRVGFKPG